MKKLFNDWRFRAFAPFVIAATGIWFGVSLANSSSCSVPLYILLLLIIGVFLFGLNAIYVTMYRPKK